MRTFRTKKVLFGFPAGTIYKIDQGPFGILPPNEEVANGRFSPWITEEPWFKDWFEEVPNLDHVKSGDVYSTSESGSLLAVHHINGHFLGWYIYKHEVNEYQDFCTRGIWGWIIGDDEYPYLKPENLVYRPGKVDKLGWDKPKIPEDQAWVVPGEKYTFEGMPKYYYFVPEYYAEGHWYGKEENGRDAQWLMKADEYRPWKPWTPPEEMVEMGPAVVKYSLETPYVTRELFPSREAAQKNLGSAFITWPAYLVQVPKEKL